MQSPWPQVISSTPRQTQAIKPSICPKALIAPGVAAKVTTKQGQREIPWPRCFPFPWVFHTFNVYGQPCRQCCFLLTIPQEKKSASSHLHDEFPYSSVKCCLPSITLVCLNLMKYFQFPEQFRHGERGRDREEQYTSNKIWHCSGFLSPQQKILLRHK